MGVNEGMEEPFSCGKSFDKQVRLCRSDNDRFLIFCELCRRWRKVVGSQIPEE